MFRVQSLGSSIYLRSKYSGTLPAHNFRNGLTPFSSSSSASVPVGFSPASSSSATRAGLLLFESEETACTCCCRAAAILARGEFKPLFLEKLALNNNLVQAETTALLLLLHVGNAELFCFGNWSEGGAITNPKDDVRDALKTVRPIMSAIVGLV